MQQVPAGTLLTVPFDSLNLILNFDPTAFIGLDTHIVDQASINMTHFAQGMSDHPAV